MRNTSALWICLISMLFAATAATAETAELPPLASVIDGFEPVTARAEGEQTFYTVWQRKKDAQLIAQLPEGYEKQRFLIVPTVAGGDAQSGVYSIWHREIRREARYVYWKRYDNQLALMEPDLSVRTQGDEESKSATARIFTDTVVLTTKIIAQGAKGEPVIDLDEVLVNQCGKFFSGFVGGANLSLIGLESIKTFERNIEVTLNMPRASGRLVTLHYSLVLPPKDEKFEPRVCDRRVGYYYVGYEDRSKNDDDSQTIRYAYRWHVEKADPELALSPPKRPITYYIEHTTPVRYRRYVREGILAWNRAFEQIGIIGAIEVHQQDKGTGAFMDIDPEDSRYSFVRWTNSHMGFAIGPVHVHPETGQIFEADIVMDEGFITSWAREHSETELARAAMASFHPETVEWLIDNPEWDPRVRLAATEDRPAVIAYLQAVRRGDANLPEAPPTALPQVWAAPAHGDSRDACAITCMPGLAGEVAMARLALDVGLLPGEDTGDKSAGDKATGLLDGLPETFIGPLLKDVIMHEVGHTMGLFHNWQGSSLYSFAEINCKDMCGQRPFSSTVMDYVPANILVAEGELVQGDHTIIDIGPYDMWAIEWGYGAEPQKTLERAGESAHAFQGDEASYGPDPRAKTWDLGENTLDFAVARIGYVKHVRKKMLDAAIADGDQWQKARRVYSRLLSIQTWACSTAARWIGGVYFHRNVKGAVGVESDPVTPAPVDRQRRALEFILEQCLSEDAFDLRPEVLTKLGTEQWPEGGHDEQDLPISDQILGVQASALTMLLNPTTLRRVLDNELRTPADADALTIPEILDAIHGEVWGDLAKAADGKATVRAPALSTIRRGLQREHLSRMIALATGQSMPGIAGETLASMARGELRKIQNEIAPIVAAELDPYSSAHLADALERITRALEATYSRER